VGDWGWRPTKDSFAEALKMYEVRSVPFAGPVSSLPFCSAEAAMCLVSLSRTCWARVGYTACGQATTAEGWLASQGDGHERIRVGTSSAARRR